MKNRKFLYTVLSLVIPIMGLSVAHADTSKVFKPSPEPVFSTPRAKPNIHMVLDDSASMKGSGSWDVTLNGKIVERRTALDYAYKALMNKYKDKAYIGVSFLWQAYDLKSGYYPNQGSGLVRLPIGDYSKKTLEQLENEYSISRLIQNSPGNTPMYPGIYEAIKMFRGQPITANGVNGTFTQFPKVALVSGKVNKETKQYYQYVEHKSPVRFRCQQNHMIVMTDGVPNDTRVWGVDVNDGLREYSPVSNRYQLINGDVNLSAYADISTSFIAKNSGEKNNHINVLGKLTADTDLRKYQTTANDNAGKPWFDKNYSKPMPIYTHTVSLGVNSKSSIYTGLTSAINKDNNKDKPGLNLGFEKDGSAEDLLSAFDTIFATIIRSTSSASAVNDSTSSALVKQAPSFDKNGNVDVKTIGTIRYDTVYDFRSYIGSIRARTSFLNPKTGKSEKVDLWSTDTTVQPNQGRYVTLSSNPIPSLYLANISTSTLGLDARSIDWLTNFKKNTDMGQLRERLYPLGSITSSDVVIANKDMLNINIAKDKISEDLKGLLEDWWLYKATFQPNNLIIVGDNDGMISFIKAQRGLAKGSKAGERDTAYFPKMLVHRFDEIARADRNSTLVMEGRTNLIDAKVYQSTEGGGEHIFATIGLTAQGGGGKGLVGYRIYAETETNVKEWNNRKESNKPSSKSVYEQVTPLFEITNEGSKKTAGFENLGYTYSGFEFFNRITSRSNIIGRDTELTGQAVAVFGNGFGAGPNKDGKQPSILYFIDAYTGKKLHEIVLDPNGMGAATPSILVRPDVMGGQQLDRIYVGDYSGTLYKVEFNGSDFTSDSTKITALFKAPKTNFGQSAISVKPLVVKARNSNLYRVFFGTGIAASHDLDRYENSKVQHSIYSITDLGKSKGASYALGNATETLAPVLTVTDLKKGSVQYQNGSKPTKEDYEGMGEYELDTTVPYANPEDEDSNEDGWYIRLIADGNNSGERIIKDPQYDMQNDAVVFFTWGINERFDKYDETMQDDPCLADFIYGKTLAYSAASGSVSNGLTGLANKGKTGRAEGGLTGEWINNSPDGNNTTSLKDISKDKFQDLVDATGEENSSIADDPNFRNKGTDIGVEGDDVTIKFETSDTAGGEGSSEDVVVSKPELPQGKKPVRLSIQTLLNS